MKKQTFSLAVLALLLILSFGASALWAQPGSKPPPDPDKMASPPDDCYTSLSPEKQKAWDTAWQEYQTKMQPLRDQMWRKNMEYKALAGNLNTKPEEIQTLINEMSDLKQQMRTEGQDFRDKLAKDGFERPWGHGRNFGPSHGYDYCGDSYGYHHHGKGGRNYKKMSHHDGWHRGGY